MLGIGKFYEIYRKWPSEKELSDFIGLTKQTISKYINGTALIVSKTQERDLNGRFMEKELRLSDEGKAKYSKLIYKVIGYA